MRKQRNIDRGKKEKTFKFRRKSTHINKDADVENGLEDTGRGKGKLG